MAKTTPRRVFGPTVLPLVAPAARGTVIALSARRSYAGRTVTTELRTLPDGTRQLIRINANGEQVGCFALSVEEQAALVKVLE